MSANYSDSDDFEDDILIMTSQGLLDDRECLVVLSPIVGISSFDENKKVNRKHPFGQGKRHIQYQSAIKSKISLSKSISRKLSNSKASKPKHRVQNPWSPSKKSSNLNISKTLFSSIRTEEEKSKNLEKSSLRRKKKVKSKKKSSRKHRNIFDLKDSDNESSDLEDPSINLKQLTADSKNNDTSGVINESILEDQLDLEDEENPCNFSDCYVNTGPRHSSPKKDKTKRRKIFDNIRKENARMKVSPSSNFQDTMVIDDSDLDFSQSFIKCSQEHNTQKEMTSSKKSVSKRPVLSLKSAAVPTFTESSYPSYNQELEYPSVILKGLTTDVQNTNAKSTVQNLSDDDLFSDEERTELLETEQIPRVDRKKAEQPYELLKNSEATLEYNNNDDNTDIYSVPNSVEFHSANYHEQSTVHNVPSSMKDLEEKSFPELSEIEAAHSSRKETISIENKDDSQHLQPLQTSSTSMPSLSPQTSLTLRPDLSSDTSLPQLSQYMSDVAALKKDDLENSESRTMHSQTEQLTPKCSYSMEADIVAVFDSEDEELFLTQSAIDRSIDNKEAIMNDEDISDEEIRMNYRPAEQKGKVEKNNTLTEECEQSTSILGTTIEKVQSDSVDNNDCEQNAPDNENCSTADSDDEYGGENVIDFEGNKCFTVTLNIYRQPRHEDFRHILYPDYVKKKKRSKPCKDSVKGIRGSIDVHVKDSSQKVFNQGKVSSKELEATSGTTQIVDSFQQKGDIENNEADGGFCLPTQVCEKNENDNVEDVDDDVYLAQTQIDYLVISSDEDSSDEVIPGEDTPSSPSTVDPNNFEDGSEPANDFEDDIDLLDVIRSSVLKVENKVHPMCMQDSDNYTIETQMVNYEMSEEEKGTASHKANSDSELYMMDTQIDGTLLKTMESNIHDDNDGFKRDREEEASHSDDGNIDPYLMDTQVGGSPSEITTEMDAYEIATQVDTEGSDDDEANSFPSCQEDLYDVKTLDIECNSQQILDQDEELLKDTSKFIHYGKDLSDEGLLKSTDSSNHARFDKAAKGKDAVNQSHKLCDNHVTTSLTDKAKSGSSPSQSASQEIGSRLISRISEDAGVSENNIVEYMSSTQIETNTTPVTAQSADKPFKPSRKTWKGPTVTKGLFDIFSPSTFRNEKSKKKLADSRNDANNAEELSAFDIQSPRSPGNLFSMFMPGNFPSVSNQSNYMSANKESMKRVCPDSHGAEPPLEPPPMKKSEASRKTQIVAPKWMSTKFSTVEKSSNAKTMGGPKENAKLIGSPRRKRKISKTTVETLSSNIASAKKAFVERNKMGGALLKHSAGKDSLLKQSDLSDVEMPNTQEIMEQGLPILNIVSPVVKKVAPEPSAENDFQQINCSKGSANNLPGIGVSSTRYSSLQAPTSLSGSSLSRAAITGEAESSKALSSLSFSLSSSDLGSQSESADQQKQQLQKLETNQGTEKASVRKIASLSKSVYLHKDALNDTMPKPICTNTSNNTITIPVSTNTSSNDTLPMPISIKALSSSSVSNTNEDTDHGKEKSSGRKPITLSKSIYLHKDDSNNSNAIAVSSSTPSSISMPSMSSTSTSVPSPIFSQHSSTSGLSKYQLTTAVNSMSSLLLSSSSTSVPLNTSSTIQAPSSNLPVKVPVGTTSPAILQSVRPTDIKLDMKVSASTLPGTFPASICTPPSSDMVMTQSKDLTAAPESISTPTSVKTNNSPIFASTSSFTPSSTKPTASTTSSHKPFGVIIRRPKLRKGILKKSNDFKPRNKSCKVSFDDSRNTIKLIEKVESRPPMMLRIDSTTKKMKRDPFRSPSQFIQTVLKWNTSWIHEQEKVKGQPPPIIEPDAMFNRLRMAYDDVHTYQDITYKLFLLEVWAMLSNDWSCYPTFLPAFIKSKPQYMSKEDEALGLLIMEVEGVTRDLRTLPMVSDVLVLDMQGKVKGSNQETTQPCEQFGFVGDVKKRRLEQSKNSVLYRPEIKGNFKEFMKPGAWVFSISIKVKFKGCVPCDLMKIRKVCTLTTALRQFQGLVEFAQIPLCPALINPDPSNSVFSLDETVMTDGNLLKYLNEEQAYAVTHIREAVLSFPNHPRVCLLQGPPGTGKSFAIMVLIHQILLNSRFEAKICLAAPSNAAVDELACRIIELSEKKCKPRNSPTISIVRLGNIDSVSKNIKPFHIVSLTDEHLRHDQQKRLPKTLQEELKAVESRISSLTTEMKNTHISEAQKVAKKKELDRLKSQDRKKLEEEMKPSHEDKRRAKYSVMNNCHVVCGTLSSFGSGEMMPLLLYRNTNRERREPFTCLIVDEATQAVEVDCLVPLQHHVNKLVLVGDQEQLPATVLSQEAKNCRYDASLFQRLHDKFESCKEQAPNPVIILKQQYRMHPEILKLPNSYFYKNMLVTAESFIQSRKSNLSPYLVFDVLDGMETSGNSGSKSNKKEAKCVASLCKIVIHLMTKKNTPSERQKKIGVICPYSDQKKVIQDSLGELGLYNILVNTVDGFQGQEKDIIILSCVRAQGSHQSVGFVDDSKRMNVALTRAKLALYIVGHRKTMSTSDLWKLLYKDAESRRLLVHVPEAKMFSNIASKRVLLPMPSHVK